MTLAGLFEGTAEGWRECADELALYINADFMIPYKRKENVTGE